MITPAAPTKAVPAALRRRWLAVGVGEAILLLLAALGLSQIWQVSYAWRWLAPAAAAVGFQLYLLRRYLHENVPVSGGGSVRPSLGPGNGLTLLRGLCVAMLAGFLLLPQGPGLVGWLPALLFTAAALMDLFDGYLARRTGSSSRLGEILDVEFDALGVLLVAALAVRYGNLPWWFVLVAAARYWFMWGLHVRRQRGLVISPLLTSRYRRPIAGTFMAFLTVMLWPPVHPPGTHVAAAVFTLPYAAVFCRDWFAASGVITPDSPAYRRFWSTAAHFVVHWLPILSRGIVILVVSQALLAGLTPNWAGFIALFGAASQPWFSGWLNSLTVVSTLATAAGILTHFTAIPIIAAATAAILTGNVTTWNALLLAAGCSLTLLGGGRYVLWEPESQRLYRRRLGEDPERSG